MKNFTDIRTLLPSVLLALLGAACSPPQPVAAAPPELALTATATEGPAPLRVQFVTEALGFDVGAAARAPAPRAGRTGPTP